MKPSSDIARCAITSPIAYLPLSEDKTVPGRQLIETGDPAGSVALAVPGALPGRWFGKGKGLGGQADLPHRVADGLRRGGRLVGKAADLGDGMLVGGGAGDEVQVAVIEVRYPQRVVQVPDGGPGRAHLRRVALHRGDPGLDRVLG